MSALHNEIGYESLRFYGPFQPQHIEKLQITRTINDHAYLSVSGMLSEEQGAACIGQNMEEEPIVIRQIDEQGQSVRRLFHGIVTRLSVHCFRGVYTFELEAASHSYQMDIQIKKRSYQDIHRTYDDLVTTMIRKYKFGDAIDTVTNNTKLGTFVLQYEETDWAFLKRLAARFWSVLVPEVTAASPKVFFGMPVGKLYKLERDISYQVRRTFHELETGKPGRRAGSYVTYVTESLQYYALGDSIALPIGSGKELVVVRAVTRMKDGLLLTRYDLQAEQDIRYARYENDQVTGGALTGSVLQVQQDLVQLQLDIDPKQDPAKACWFPVATRYAAEEHSGWYDMPEVGERVELYLPTCREHEAYIMDSRQHRQAQGEPDVKVWRHAQGSGVDMSEQEITLSTSGAFSITLHEGNGITVSSPEDVRIQGGHVKLDAGQELSLTAGSALYLTGGASSMVLDGETDIKAPVVDQVGSLKAPVFVMDLPPVPEPPLMNIKDYEAAQAAAMKGSSTNTANTPTAKITNPADQKQADGLLGTESKLLGAIPMMGAVAGAVVGVAMGAALGGFVGAVVGASLQASAAVPVRSTGMSHAGGGGAKGGLHPLKYLAGLFMQGLISQYEHEKAKDAYYSKWLLGKVFTSARHIASSGGLQELVKNLVIESNAIAQAYQQVPKNIREKWNRDYKEQQRIQAAQKNQKLELWRERKIHEYTSFWNQTDYFTDNWWQDEDKLKQAQQALRTEITMQGKISLYDINDPNKMAALQRIVNTKRTQVWDEKTLNAIEDGLVAMGVDSTNAIELDKEKMDALIMRHNRGFIGQKSADYAERTGLDNLVEDTIYGFVGARAGMASVGKPSAKPKQPTVSEKPPVKPNSKGGPGVNRPIDEFDDTAIYKGANSSRSTNSSKPVEGTGQGLENRGYKPQPGERTTTREDWKAQDREARIRSNLSQSSPINIPPTASVKIQSKTGYEQIQFKWSDGYYKYEGRWHTRTPGAPQNQGNTWVVERTTPGNTTGQQKTYHILTGDNQWTPRHEWQAAINARKNGTATAEQNMMLESGHWPAP